MDARLEQLPVLAEDGERLLVVGVDDLDGADDRDGREQHRERRDAEDEALPEEGDPDEEGDAEREVLPDPVRDLRQHVLQLGGLAARTLCSHTRSYGRTLLTVGTSSVPLGASRARPAASGAISEIAETPAYAGRV
ncbi:hypothetical protein [Halorubrum sp. T3]|uniref:hypothetical protein n=1 Tax=Halorubrum sp. T3 TaxID=1194088 RepID=UPI0003623B1E|nr:hypothetical protein [Halorubrum sp. T3]